MVAKGILKPTISREEDQFLSELVEKCCEFEANERIDFKTICNLIETQFSKLDQTQQPNKINNQEINQKQNLNEEYNVMKNQNEAKNEDYNKAPPASNEYNISPAQHDYNSMQLQN